MSLIKKIFQPLERKFTPASAEVNWTRIETLVHGPGAGDDSKTYNSALFACLMAVATAYTEPPLTVYQTLDDGNKEKLTEHPLQVLLDTPTPAGELSPDEMLFWVAWAKHVDGNAYWLKLRSGNAQTGNVVQLWPVSPSLMEPVTLKNSGDWISYYNYRTGPNKVDKVPVENVVHFRLGLDDRDMRKGLSPLKALVREMSTDDEASKFSHALLKNFAIPGLVVIPAGGDYVDPDDGDKIAAKLSRKFGSDNRGNIAVMSSESKIEQFGFSPEELDLTVLHRIPEERISAVIGVPAILAGLGAGLDRATYSNARELGEMFTERKLIPQWRMDSKKLNVSLKPDFTDDPTIAIEYDLADVRALQEDQDARYNRLSVAVGRKPFMKVNEARADIGLDPDPDPGSDELGQAQPAQLQPTTTQDTQTMLDDQTAKLLADLDKWRRKAINAFQQHDRGRLLEDFALSVIPPESRYLISEMLEDAQSVNDIERIFSYQNGHKP